MESSFISKNIEVDNVTMEKNSFGQLQIKGGAVGVDLLNLNYDKLKIISLKKFVNSGESLAVTFINDWFLFATTSADLEKHYCSFTSPINIFNARFTTTIKGGYNNTNSRTFILRAYKNGTKFYENSWSTSNWATEITKEIITNINKNDIIDFTLQMTVNAFYPYVKLTGLKGSFEEISENEINGDYQTYNNKNY